MIIISFRKIKATKSYLLELQKKLGFALKGEKFLEIKREQLNTQIKKYWVNFPKEQTEFYESYRKSMVLLNQSYKEMGKRDLLLISDISKIQYKPLIDINYNKKSSFSIPEISFKLDKKGKLPPYGFENTSHFLDDLQISLIDFITKLLNLAEKEHFIVNSAMNFKKINRRINGLNNTVIPNLQLDIKRVKDNLEENDRENFIRLKKTKDLIFKKKLLSKVG